MLNYIYWVVAVSVLSFFVIGYVNTERLEKEVVQLEVKLENEKKSLADCEQKLRVTPFNEVGITLREVTDGEINTTINDNSNITDGNYSL